MNEHRTCGNSDTKLAQPGSRPVRYELIDRDGICHGQSTSPAHLAAIAMRLWPDQSQDEDRSGRGWDISVVGAGDE